MQRTKTRSGYDQPSFSVYCFCSFVFLTSGRPAMMSVHGNRTLGNRALPRATERRDQSDPILSRSGHGGRVSLFLLFFSPLFHLSYEYKNLGPGPLGFSPCHPSWIMTEEHPRKERDRDTVARIVNANHLELGNRKRTILFPPNPSLHLSSLELTTRSGCPATEAEFLCFCFAFFL